jgi:hypothetical protein
MHINPHVQSYIEKHLLEPNSIRRLANGSIDYTYYDGEARTCRSNSTRRTGSVIAGILRRAVGLLTPMRGQKPEIAMTPATACPTQPAPEHRRPAAAEWNVRHLPRAA